MKSNRQKATIAYKRTSTRLSADFLAENLQDRREWHDIFKVIKEKILQPRILYPARVDKQDLTEFSTTRAAL